MFEHLTIPDVFVFTPKRHGDARGWFSETWSRAALEPKTGPLDWVQDNHSRSGPRGVLRGLHMQIGANAQDKLVRCVRGAIRDVAVDVRSGSPSFGRYVAAVLSADNGAQIFVPKGFAHGFVTLEPDAEVIYKVTAPYDKAAETGLAYDDPGLAIDWGVDAADITLSERDRLWPRLADAPVLFTYSV